MQLLLYLHPDWDPLETAWLRGSLHYTLLLSPLSLLVHLLASRILRVRVRRLLPWSLLATVAAGALALGGHASHYSYYLPPDLNARMVRAALWLAFGTAIGFYTALAHSLHWRRYGSRTIAFFVLLTASAVLVPFERRMGFSPNPRLGPRLPPPEIEGLPGLVWIELPTATFDATLPLAEQGRLPFFASLLERAGAARLKGLEPTLPLAARTTLETGLRPDQHGFAEPWSWRPGWSREERLRLLPLLPAFEAWGLAGARRLEQQGPERRPLDLQDLLARCGFEVRVADRRSAQHPPQADVREPSSPTRAVRRGASERELELLGLRDLANELLNDRRTLATIRRDLEERQQRTSRVPFALFARLPGLELASRQTYGAFWAVEQKGARGRQVERRAAALTTYYAALDRELSELASELPGSTLLVLVSAYGISPPPAPARIWGELASSNSLWGGTLRDSPDGSLLIQGSGILAGAFVELARLEDVLPTVLYALGLPGARDLPGRLLTRVFEPSFLQQRPLTFLPSYEGLAPLAPASASAAERR